MSATYVFPGSFCPPTYGHFQTLRKAAIMFGHVVVICSTNPQKHDNWFTPQECVRLWHSYDLPENVSVQYFGQQKYDLSQVTMIRGLREVSEMDYEQQVMDFNRQEFGINNYVHLFCDPEFSQISSSRARQLATKLELEKLPQYVSPLVASALLEKVLQAKKLFLVVGKPGSGKSTWLKQLCQIDGNYWVDTDQFSEQLKPMLRQKFGRDDLVELYLEQPEQVTAAIKDPWFDLLGQSLKNTPVNSNIFVEIAYGLAEDKQMFRFVGGQVIYVGCDDSKQNLDRIDQRGTPEHKPFVDRIPGWTGTVQVAKKHQLKLLNVDTAGSLADLERQAEQFNLLLGQGGALPWKTFSPE
ncbi:adenylyltransferase/cytidyltransferase family protein [Candidatus Parcubacteria bacterium]|jgi:pantetheine-phosphate adenylyltransferase|nr:adenylyltransferase/cytidyltransferase family protein [Candidatus Parcubacteria bacterium]